MSGFIEEIIELANIMISSGFLIFFDEQDRRIFS